MNGIELYEFDQLVRAEGFSVICGVDEAGRGPLAGDVYAAAVILDKDSVIEGVNDSKKISPKKREMLFDKICQRSVFCIATASVDEIERINILNASMLAMRRAVEGLARKPELALIDGSVLREMGCPARCVIGGDHLSASIAAASILAKVARDRYMRELAVSYPQYQFDEHKGYGTKGHYAALEKYGICPVHRRSFLKNLEAKLV